MTELAGVFSAVATPFSPADGEVDEETLRALVERTIAGGVHGLVPGGSTGEFATQTLDERRHVLEVVVEQAAGRVPVVPHVGAMTTRDAVSLARHAQSNGATAIMAVAPFYEPLDAAETKAYFLAVADAVSLPVMVYNLPVATGVNLLPAEVAALAREHANIQYVKDTTGDFSQAAKLIHDHGDDVKTFVGWDTLFLAAMVEGAAGSIVGASNFVVRDLVDVYNSVHSGNLAQAKRTWNKIFPLMQFLLSGGYVAGVKAALDILGYPVGPPRAAIAELDADRRSELEQILKAIAGA